jgi:hypothetical protein
VLSAFAYDSGADYEKDLIVAVADLQNMRVTSGYKEGIQEDAAISAGEGSLTLDTARYVLSKGVRAFGVRFTTSAPSPSCAESSDWDELTLFVQDRHALRPIFRKEMQYQHALQGCIGHATGHDVWEHGVRTLSVMSSRTNGFFDLRLTETVTAETNMDNLPGNIDPRRRTHTELFKYNGATYEKASE